MAAMGSTVSLASKRCFGSFWPEVPEIDEGGSNRLNEPVDGWKLARSTQF